MSPSTSRTGHLLLVALGCGACSASAADAPSGLRTNRDAGDDRCPRMWEAVAQETPLSRGFTPAEVLAFTVGEHTAPLDWSRNGDERVPNTRVSLSFVDPQTWLVRGDDRSAMDTGDLSCLEHVIVTGQAHLATEDGQFDEIAPLILHSTDGLRAWGILTLNALDLVGTYARKVHAADPSNDACVLSLRFGLEIAPGDFTGEFVQTVALAPCEEVHAATPIATRGGGWWGRKSFQPTPDAGSD